MLLARLGEDEDVVAVHLHKPAEHGRAGARRADSGSGPPGRVERQGCAAEDRVHEAHQHRRHTVQAEGADAELVLAAGDAERRLVLVLLPNPKLHVGHREVQLREEARAARLVDELVDVRQRLHRPLRDGVEPAVVQKRLVKFEQFPCSTRAAKRRRCVE